MKQKIINGVYFLHSSFLEEVSESWISKRKETSSVKLLRLLIMQSLPHLDGIKNLITCDKTIKKFESSKYQATLPYFPAIFDIIDEKSLPGDENLSHDEYSLKVASLKGITGYPRFFLVADSEKGNVKKKATSQGYTLLNILSAEDFDLSD